MQATQNQGTGKHAFKVALTNEISAVLMGPLLDNPDTASEIMEQLERSGSGVEIVTPRNTAGELNIVVPYYPQLDGCFEATRHLTDEQLAKISGGAVFEILGLATSFGLMLGFAASTSTVAGVKIATAGTLTTIIGAVSIAGLAASQITMYSGIGVGIAAAAGAFAHAQSDADVNLGHAS